MGKGIDNLDRVRRDEEKSYIEMGDGKFVLAEGFSAMSINLNANQDEVKYVDEKSARTNVLGYAKEMAFTYDAYKEYEVHEAINKIFKEELIGKEATKEMLQVDFTQKGEGTDEFVAYKRPFTIVPESYGDDANKMTYTGTFKANGDVIVGTATSEDNWDTCTFKEPVQA